MSRISRSMIRALWLSRVGRVLVVSGIIGMGSVALSPIAAAAEQDCVAASALVKQGLDRADGSDAERDLYTQAIAKCPGMGEAHYSLGVALEKFGKLDEAIAAIEKAIDVSDQPGFRVALGNLLVGKNKLDDARHEFDRALAAQPKNAAASQGVALVLERQGKSPEAIAVLERAREQDPTNALTFYNLGALYQKQGQEELALTAFERATSLNPKDPDAHLYYGLLLERLGRLDDAARSMEKAAALNLTDPRMHEALGMIHQRIGDLDKAELALRKAVTLAPEATSPQLNLAVVLISKKQEGLAEEILKRAVERDNRNSELFTVLGWAELQLGKFKDAEEHLRRAVELDGKNAAAHNNLGVLFSRQGKKDEARREFNTALSLNSALDSARRNLSELE